MTAIRIEELEKILAHAKEIGAVAIDLDVELCESWSYAGVESIDIDLINANDEYIETVLTLE